MGMRFRSPRASSLRLLLWLRYDVLGTPLRDWLDFPEERRFHRRRSLHTGGVRARNNHRH